MISSVVGLYYNINMLLTLNESLFSTLIKNIAIFSTANNVNTLYIYNQEDSYGKHLEKYRIMRRRDFRREQLTVIIQVKGDAHSGPYVSAAGSQRHGRHRG